MTGLSGAGKTTIAAALCRRLRDEGHLVEDLDGDEVRARLSPGLGFSKQDREVHNQRMAYLAGLLSKNGVTVVVPIISPYAHMREAARAELSSFVEVYVKCPLDECIRRDPKGLYKRALTGEIRGFTGLDDPYEEPLHPEVVVSTAAVDVCAEKILVGVGALVRQKRGYPQGVPMK